MESPNDIFKDSLSFLHVGDFISFNLSYFRFVQTVVSNGCYSPALLLRHEHNGVFTAVNIYELLLSATTFNCCDDVFTVLAVILVQLSLKVL